MKFYKIGELTIINLNFVLGVFKQNDTQLTFLMQSENEYTKQFKSEEERDATFEFFHQINK